MVSYVIEPVSNGYVLRIVDPKEVAEERMVFDALEGVFKEITTREGAG